MFLHFGALHLLLNMWALWDGGQLTERMYGHVRFLAIYFLSGISGNLVSLVSHQGQAVSGGASGAIFGVYGGLLVFLWRERHHMHPREFRWLFWGASGFAAATIALGLLIPGIDNAAHGGGLLAGVLSGVVLARGLDRGETLSLLPRVIAAGVFAVALLVLAGDISAPAYRWRDEALARKEIGEFIKDDANIGRAWNEIANDGRKGGASFGELADRIDAAVGDRYEESFEHLSRLSSDPALPSAAALNALRRYAEVRRDASRTLAEGLRRQDPKKIQDAMALERQARELRGGPVRPRNMPSN
jgi:rhomboid protease GluP